MTFKPNKKLLITLGLTGLVVFGSMANMQQPQEQKAKNLKVLPKNLTHKQLDHIMDEWAHALGVRCGACHVRDAATNKMDFASDAKPEKNVAREMFKMTSAINKKYFEAKKDSLGMMMETGIACVTCHNGKAHPEGGMHHDEAEVEKK